LGPFAGLAVCQYAGEHTCYLFYCDGAWRPLTDTWHATLEDAQRQAEFEFEHVSRSWAWAAPEWRAGGDTDDKP
jgi:hypothetical protein